MSDAGRAQEWGVAMRALANDRQRCFVGHLMQVAPGRGMATAAARLAGYGTATSSKKSIGVIATRLMADDRIQLALLEEGRKRFATLAPVALASLEQVLLDRKHPQHLKGIATVLDRVFPIEQISHIKVEHRGRVVVATADVLKRIHDLAVRAGIQPSAMPPIIEGNARRESNPTP